MEWLAQNWVFIALGAIAVLLIIRIVVALLPRRRAPRHTGQQIVRVVGVGGAGGNAVNQMVRPKRDMVEYVAINTDGQVLEQSLADRRVRIGDSVTRGLGAGGDPTVGRRAAEADAEAIQEAMMNADLVFVAAGMGGGTGSGAAPLVAGHAREVGALTIGVVTLPFAFEGVSRRRIATAAVAELRPNVDTLLVIENERVNAVADDHTSLAEAFRTVNDVLGQTIHAVVNIMATPGIINLDFADIRAIMTDGGIGLTGIGRATGPDRATQAARQAVDNPLLSLELRGARAVLLHVAGSSKLALHEVTAAAQVVREAADEEANVIFGATFDDHLKDELQVTVIATRFPERRSDRDEPRGATAHPAVRDHGQPVRAGGDRSPVRAPGRDANGGPSERDGGERSSRQQQAHLIPREDDQA